MVFKRNLSSRLETNLRAGRSVLLFGPRQTGKTTLIQGLLDRFPVRLEYALQLPSVRVRLESDPETIRREAEALGSAVRPLVFIDEIQKAPGIMDVLQYLLDQKRIVLVASGSSARKMRHAHTNWLPGRVLMEFLHPLTWAESALVRDAGFPPDLLDQRLLFGALPGILSQADPRRRAEDLDAYSSLYLEEEIRQEAAVRRLPSFIRFLELAAMESSGSPNASKLASQVGVSHTSIRDYYQILEDSLVVHRLGAFGRSRADILKKSKYYFFDLGVRNAASRLGHDKALLTLQRGLLFEHHVVLEVLARRGLRASYWRTKRGDEVDLVVEGSGKVFALEIKSSERPKPSDFSGLAAFRELERCDGAFLICQVEKPQRFGAMTALPWWQLHSIWD